MAKIQKKKNIQICSLTFVLVVGFFVVGGGVAMKRGTLLLIILGVLFCELSYQDCRTTSRRISASSYRDPDVSAIRTGGRLFTFTDERECDEDDEEG